MKQQNLQKQSNTQSEPIKTGHRVSGMGIPQQAASGN